MKVPSFVTNWMAGIVAKAQTFTAVSSSGGWFNILRESYGGAWQASVTVDAPKELLAFSGVYSPLTLIANDIAKLRIKLVEEHDGIQTEVTSGSPFLPVLRKPNHYQNRIKFLEQWILSKLLYGNTYVLKERDARGLVTALYVLDATRVTTLVADSGDVYYQLSTDYISGLKAPVTLPASQIIHDMCCSLWHPLVGVSPIYAAGLSATHGRKIQNNSSRFFENMSRPSGMLTAAGTISDATALRLKTEFEANYSAANLGRLAVLGDGLKYEPMTIPPEQAQLIEQLEWTVRDIASVFHVPLFKVGGQAPANNNIEASNIQYYTDCLQSLIEQFELCMEEGLALPDKYRIELDIDGLARMDTPTQITTLNESVKGGWMSPNEARAKRNMPPVKGGESPMIQQQNYSLQALAKRDAKDDPFATGASAPPPQATLPQPTPSPTPAPEQKSLEAEALVETMKLINTLTKGLEND